MRNSIEESIGTSTLRKTFGYRYYQQTKDLSTLQQIFGHSLVFVTLNFIGVEENISDQTIFNFSFFDKNNNLREIIKIKKMKEIDSSKEVSSLSPIFDFTYL
jgi:hypothetical protein